MVVFVVWSVSPNIELFTRFLHSYTTQDSLPRAQWRLTLSSQVILHHPECFQERSQCCFWWANKTYTCFLHWEREHLGSECSAIRDRCLDSFFSRFLKGSCRDVFKKLVQKDPDDMEVCSCLWIWKNIWGQMSVNTKHLEHQSLAKPQESIVARQKESDHKLNFR